MCKILGLIPGNEMQHSSILQIAPLTGCQKKPICLNGIFAILMNNLSKKNVN